MYLPVRGALLTALSLAAGVPGAGADEVEIDIAEVPSAVLDSLKVHYPAATFLGFTRETSEGTTLFEAMMTIEDHHVDVLIDSLGVLAEEEAEIPVNSLPAKVRAALGRSGYARGTVNTAERHVLPGSGTAPTYELQLDLRGDHYELVFDAEGALIRESSVDEDD